MKKLVLTGSALFLFLSFFLPPSLLGGELKIFHVDPVHSTAFFKVGHYGFGFVRGGFTDISGKIIMDKANRTDSRVEIEIKTKSIDTAHSVRDEHLRSSDFFDVEKFPVMSFKSRKIVKRSENHYDVTGDFTLHGVTKTVTVPVTVIGEGKDHNNAYRSGFEARFSIKRSQYEMTKYIPAAGDHVDITLVVEGILQ